ncbi:dihydropteroate synthase [Planctellipticum variicoloris]|uniref:dihydropteroate synthase n=1 Tax=Planctellipticum variicoloris TaxID=3064265 RepID=UPI003013BB96|nr:dihydropteroate synthase [Planctomycetaceae bacterium SH412]
MSMWTIRGTQIPLSDHPLFMGIVNATPDSFSDGGRFLQADAAVEHALGLVSEGAALLDIGGESTRPGSEAVPVEQELERVIPVIARLAEATSVPISVDTCKAEVARRALRAGARIVNDISGLQFDPEIVNVCRDFGAGVVCMHIQGTPRTMQVDPKYDDVVEEVYRYFAERLDSLTRAGLSAESIVLDPGIGFGKTAEHNLELLAGIPRLRELGRPVLIGHSRKRFVKRVLGHNVDERLFGTIGISLAAAVRGAQVLRVHDVAASRDAWLAFQAVVRWPNVTLPPE